MTPDQTAGQVLTLREVDHHGIPPYQRPALDGQSAQDRSGLTEYPRIKHPQP